MRLFKEIDNLFINQSFLNDLFLDAEYFELALFSEFFNSRLLFLKIVLNLAQINFPNSTNKNGLKPQSYFMDASSIMNIAFSLLPTLVVGFVAYFFFTNYIQNEQDRRIYKLKKQTHEDMLSVRLQALERMTLYLERIDPGSLLVRVKPAGDDKHNYERVLIQAIEQEFEHNLTQQLYLSSECWDAIRATKNSTITLIRRVNMDDSITSANKLREEVLTQLMDKPAPSVTGIEFLKKEAKSLWQA